MNVNFKNIPEKLGFKREWGTVFPDKRMLKLFVPYKFYFKLSRNLLSFTRLAELYP